MRRARFVVLVLVATAAVAAAIHAQQQAPRPPQPPVDLQGILAARNATPGAPDYDGSFRFCRLRFRNALEGDGGGWSVDYPRADQNLSTRLSELTRTRITTDSRARPNHTVVGLNDQELFACPFLMMTEPGGAMFDAGEAAQLRTYLLKGGFLWTDDSWGTYAWDWWTRQLRKALPPDEFQIVDLPMDHPIYHSMFDVDRVPQIPNIGQGITSTSTSERGADSPRAHGRAVVDRDGRVMVYMTHNTDFGDAFEEESVSPEYFRRFSVEAYEMGVGILLYAMTH